MAIKYTPTEAMIETGATQYNVQPNLTVGRAFQAAQDSLQKGMQLKEQINEEDFRRRQTDLRNTMTTFQEEYANANYAERQLMAEEVNELMADPYTGDDRWNRELNRMGNEFASRVRIQLAEETEQRARAAAAAAQQRQNMEAQLSYLNVQNQMLETTDVAAQRELANNWYADNVEAVEGVDDELYLRNMTRWTELNRAVVTNRRAVADEMVTTDVMGGVIAEVQAEGGFTPERYAEIAAGLENLSNYEANSSVLRSQLADFTLSTIRAQYNDPDRPVTQEDVDLLNVQLDDLAEADPFIRGSSQFLTTQNMAANMQTTINTQRVSAISPMLQDSTVSQAIFDNRVNELLDDGLISEEEASNFIYQKGAATQQRIQREVIVPFVQSTDVDSLVNLVETGQASRATISGVIRDSLELQYGSLVNDAGVPPEQAAAHLLQQYNQYDAQGMAPTSIPAVDAILSSPRSGEVMTGEQLSSFLQVFEAARENDYATANQSRAAEDYLTLRTMVDLGVPRPAEQYHSALTSPSSATPNAVDEALSAALGADAGWFRDGLNPNNVVLLRTTLRPVVRRLIQSGIPVDQVEDMVSTGLDGAFMRVDPSGYTIGGRADEALIPRSEGVPNNAAYRRAFEGINEAMSAEGGSLDYFGPSSPSDPESDWLALDENGQMLYIPYEDVTTAARTGRLPQ